MPSLDIYVKIEDEVFKETFVQESFSFSFFKSALKSPLSSIKKEGLLKIKFALLKAWKEEEVSSLLLKLREFGILVLYTTSDGSIVQPDRI